MRSAAAFLSAARAKRTAGADVYLGTTIDQVFAKKIGQDTALPSLELGIEDVGYTGICNYGYSCSYVNTVSWETPTKPLPMEINPQAVFRTPFWRRQQRGSAPPSQAAGSQYSRLDHA